MGWGGGGLGQFLGSAFVNLNNIVQYCCHSKIMPPGAICISHKYAFKNILLEKT